MSIRVLADRYAQAFINYCGGLENLKDSLLFLQQWNTFMKENEKIEELLLHPQIPFEKKRKVLEQLEDFASYSEIVQKFILYLVQKERIDCFSMIIEQIDRYISRQEDIVKGTLKVSRKLSSASQKKLIRQLENKMGKKLDVHVVEDPSLLGGLVLETENTILDASIKNYFKRFLQDLQKGV